MSKIKIIECPRDAMQGWPRWIPTENKQTYINSLLKVGFDTIDFGSFVSPKAIPQMRDTAEVLQFLSPSPTNLLAIVANLRGAQTAVAAHKVKYLGYPFSVSPTFQQRNTGSTQQESIATVQAIQQLCVDNGKELVVYLSMGFGNPYGDDYSKEVLLHWADVLASEEVKIISLADTVGLAVPEAISLALQALMPQYSHIEFGVHLHSAPYNWKPKLAAAYNAGCKRFDSAIMGIGGCPMAGNHLVGNMATEWLLQFFAEAGEVLAIDSTAWDNALQEARHIFAAHGVDAKT